MNHEPSRQKRISGTAYQALRSALALVFWYKPTLERYLRTALRQHPEILRGIDFQLPAKREIANTVVDRLVESESTHQHVTIALMIELSNMTRFIELEGLDDERRSKYLPRAQQAVAELKGQTSAYERLLAERERLEAERLEYASQAASRRQFSEELSALRVRFFELHAMQDSPQRRGQLFEPFLNALFALFNLDPRLSYATDTEQIDGAFSFDTDDYIVEAKWTKSPVSRAQADAFAAKVQRKGKNALGLIVSINGLTEDARKAYDRSTPFMTLDGADLVYVLEERIPLDEMLRRKKRHANETGECYFPASRM
jgi:hypothetical protein